MTRNPPRGLSIESYSEVHREQIIKFVKAILEGEFGLRYRRRDLEQIEQQYHPPGGFWLALEGKVIVGTVGLIHIQENSNESRQNSDAEGQGVYPLGMLKRMYVAPSWRGKGLGAHLYELVEQHALKEKWRSIYLDTDPSMELARTFYHRKGFEDLVAPLVDPGPGHEGCLCYMLKTLDQSVL